MTYDQSAHITDLQRHNTALVDRVRILERVANDRGPAISAILRAYHEAIAKHQRFPAAMDSQGAILAEETIEMAMEMLIAVLSVLRSINDHRDEVPNLERIREETTHVGAVAVRMLGRLDGAKG